MQEIAFIMLFNRGDKCFTGSLNNNKKKVFRVTAVASNGEVQVARKSQKFNTNDLIHLLFAKIGPNGLTLVEMGLVTFAWKRSKAVSYLIKYLNQYLLYIILYSKIFFSNSYCCSS